MRLPLPIFAKPALSADDLVALLVRRGLAVDDREAAKWALDRLGYYRLSAYMLPLQRGGGGPDRHDFQPGHSFDTVLKLYRFDRSLRLSTFGATEHVEVAFRAAISDHMSRKAGPHWFLDPRNLAPTADHARLLARLEDDIGHTPAHAHKRTVAIRHYYASYDAPRLPPSWMVLEALSFGAVSQIFRLLENRDRKTIAQSFGIDDSVLQSWTHAISYTRNICAHHARLWNRMFTIKPMVARVYYADLTPNTTFYAQAVAIQILLRNNSADFEWSADLNALLTAHPTIAPAALGFPAGWSARPIWR